MKWEGKDLKGYPEIIDTAFKLRGKKRTAFVNAYLKSGKYAAQNIGYVAGYYDGPTARKILKIFGTKHPVFGGL